jgi:methylated-DNA-[protein]-cysteine S-methyltransferase
MKLNLGKIDSPLGVLLVVTDSQDLLRALDFADHNARLQRNLREHYGECDLTEASAPRTIADCLQRYFDGQLAALNNISVATPGGALQRQVWAALRRIPAGQTTSYGDLARALGYTDPRAAIDIGAANGANPIAIVVPCHRVIGKHGDLKGYAGGFHRKRWLLEHEGAIPSVAPVRAPEMVRLPGF